MVGPDDLEICLEEWLGRGATGAVYRAKVRSDDRLFAVKVLADDGLEAEWSIDAFFNEAKLASEVRHQNVIQVVHAGMDPQLGPYLIMEYASGGTLKSLLAERVEHGQELDIDEAVGIMCQIANGCRAINSILVHRDIKPDNIMIDRGLLKVGDFGISKVIGMRTRTRSFKGIGPITHMAPEAWRGDSVTEKADIYSAGLVFYEILSLEHPLAANVRGSDPFDEWRKAQLFTVVPDIRSARPDAPSQLAQLLLRMTAKHPQDRPGWDEIVSVLEALPADTGAGSAVDDIVERALKAHQQRERTRLEDARRVAMEKEANDLYRASFLELVRLFDGMVAEFNAKFQIKKIQKQQSGDGFSYDLPGDEKLLLSQFSPAQEKVAIRGRELIGGAFGGRRNGMSCNFVLLRESTDDPYGRWHAVAFTVGAFVDTSRALSRLAHRPSRSPFGMFSETDFYHHLPLSAASIHSFACEWPEPIEVVLRSLLQDAIG